MSAFEKEWLLGEKSYNRRVYRPSDGALQRFCYDEKADSKKAKNT